MARTMLLLSSFVFAFFFQQTFLRHGKGHFLGTQTYINQTSPLITVHSKWLETMLLWLIISSRGFAFFSSNFFEGWKSHLWNTIFSMCSFGWSSRTTLVANCTSLSPAYSAAVSSCEGKNPKWVLREQTAKKSPYRARYALHMCSDDILWILNLFSSMAGIQNCSFLFFWHTSTNGGDGIQPDGTV